MSKLLIVESPGKIKKISEYLGPSYIVMASCGHIIDLNNKTMSIDLNTFEPDYIVMNDGKADIVRKLINACKSVNKNNILLGSDEDREGEMIAWSLARELNINNPKRIVFNSITKKELELATKNPKNIDINLVQAQQTRRILDRLAGYIISPILSINFKEAKSAGRVQSVVVRILVDKEHDIENFYSQQNDTYFYITSNIKINNYEISTKLFNINIKPKDNESTESKSSKSYAIFAKSDETLVMNIIKKIST